ERSPDAVKAHRLYGRVARLPTALLARAAVCGQHGRRRGLRMASVFLSYDRDDAGKARPIAIALEKAGHSVWWDERIGGGSQYAKESELALKSSDIVVALWRTALCS